MRTETFPISVLPFFSLTHSTHDEWGKQRYFHQSLMVHDGHCYTAMVKEKNINNKHVWLESGDTSEGW